MSLCTLGSAENSRERGQRSRRESRSAVRTVLGKRERNRLNTPRYEYNDVYTHGD